LRSRAQPDLKAAALRYDARGDRSLRGDAALLAERQAPKLSLDGGARKTPEKAAVEQEHNDFLPGSGRKT
jgi:hypothetical protein